MKNNNDKPEQATCVYTTSNSVKQYESNFSTITLEELLEMIQNTTIYFNSLSSINCLIPDKFKIEIK